MHGSRCGNLFSVTTWGESHGPAIGCVIDGCPPGLPLDVAQIQSDLDRRRPGTSRHTSQRREPDRVRILSGLFEGRTTGTPLSLSIENVDARSRDYQNLATDFRPGHADYCYVQKYGLRDHRGGGRSSARETAARVAAGAVARAFLAQQGVQIRGCLIQLGRYVPSQHDWAVVEDNPFFWPAVEDIAQLEAYMDELRRAGDSIGARLQVEATGLPPGLGEPVFGRLDALLAAALMGINAVKAVEIGDGLDCVEQKGSEHRDEMTPEGFLSNHAGGILGGISTGQDIIAKVVLKPTSSIRIPGRSVDVQGQSVAVVTTGRHDPCVGIRAVPIAEAMLALVLTDCWLLWQSRRPQPACTTPVLPAGKR